MPNNGTAAKQFSSVSEQRTTQVKSHYSASIGCCWLILLALALLSVTNGYGHSSLALRSSAGLALLGGVAGFIRHGRERVTTAGTFCLTMSLIAGYGGWYWPDNPDGLQVGMQEIAWADITLVASTAAMYLLFWRGTENAFPLGLRSVQDGLSRGPERLVLSVGVILFLGGLLGVHEGINASGLTSAAAYVGIVLIAVGLFRTQRRSNGWAGWAIVAICFVVYYTQVFTGGGRLTLVSLGIAVGIISQRGHTYRVKCCALILVVPTLIAFAAIGRSRSDAPQGYQFEAGGLGSVVSPVSDFARLIDTSSHGQHGATLLAEMVVLVPRGLWHNKPDQLGRVAAQELYPRLTAVSDQSIAITTPGEWYFNFSWIGIIVMVLVIGFIVRWVDRHLATVTSRGVSSAIDAFRMSAWAVVAGSGADLAWDGTATWSNRDFLRLAILIPFALWAWGTTRSRGRSGPPDVAQGSGNREGGPAT